MIEYDFKLNWDELPDDLQEQKIEEYLDNDIDESDENKMSRQEAEQDIKAHFPIYF